MGFFDDSAAKRAQAERDRKADKLLREKKHGRGALWGDSGRAETKPGLFGLGSRVVKDIERENAKSGSYGLFGAKHVSAKAARAQKNAGRSKSWWS